MPRDISRMPRRPFAGVIETTKREVRQEMAQSGAQTPQVLVGAEPSNLEVLDLEGNTVERHDFMLGVDALGDKAARLKVNGRKRSYLI